MNRRKQPAPTPSSSSNELRLFLPDEPLGGLEIDDVLGHREYAATLAKAILAAKPPFTIGLFGEWGVGKTTIAKGYLPAELSRVANEESVGFVYFDVWKYQGDALRRQLLREVSSSLQNQRALKGYNVDRELEDLEVESSDSRFALTLSPTHILAALVRFLLYWLIALLTIQVFRLGNLQNLTGPSAGAAAALVLIREIGSSILPAEIRVTRKQVASADQFEAKFRHLMDSVRESMTRVVIVLDNLDRCEARVAVEMLDTIKTFLEPAAKHRPIFVVPCDIEAIRRHISSVRREAVGPDNIQEAGEYLRKFFNATVSIQPLLDTDLRSLVESSVARMTLTKDSSDAERQGIVDVTVRAFRRNPRRIKQFLNNVALKRLMVVERENAGQLPVGAQSQLAVIAKVTVIEDEWPEAMKLVQDDPRSLDQMTAVAIDLPIKPSPRAMEVMKAYPELGGFLKATRTIRSDLVSAIARLKAPPAETGLSSYAQFRSAVTDGSIGEVEEVLANAKEGPEAYVRTFAELVGELVRNRQTSALVNAITAGSTVKALQTGAVARNVAEAVLDRDVQGNLHLLAPKRLLHLLSIADTDAGPRAVTTVLGRAARQDLTSYLTESGAVAWARDAAEGVAEIAHALPDAQVNDAREMGKLAIQATKVPVLVGLTSVPQQAQRLLDEPALAEALRTYGLGTVTGGDSALLLDGPALVWDRCKSWVGLDTVGAFAAAVTAALSNMTNPPTDPTALVSLLQLSFESRDALMPLPEVPANELSAQVGSRYPHVDAEFRPRLVATLASLRNSDHTALLGALVQVAGDQVGVLTKVLADRELIERTPDEVLQSIGSTCQSRAAGLSGTDLQQMLEALADDGHKLGWPIVSATYADSARRLEVAAVSQALQSRKEQLANTGVVEASATAYVERMRSGSWSSWLPALDALSSLQSYLSPAQATEIALIASVAIESMDASARQEILKRFAARPDLGPLSEVGAKVLWDRLAKFAGSRPGDPGFGEILRWIADNTGSVEIEHVEALAELLERSGETRTSADRDVGAATLSELPMTQDRRDLRIESLLGWAQREIGSTRHSIWRSAIRLAGPDRRSRGARAISRALKDAGPEDESAVAELLATWGEIARVSAVSSDRRDPTD